MLHAAGILPTARYVVFQTFDDWTDNIDLLDALHPQTILAYGMNGRDLPVPHGAPVRLRVETQMGYKSMKFLRRMVVPDEFDDGGAKGNIENGWAWYTGIRRHRFTRRAKTRSRGTHVRHPDGSRHRRVPRQPR